LFEIASVSRNLALAVCSTVRRRIWSMYISDGTG